VAPSSIARFKANLKVLFRKGWGRNLGRFIQSDFTPVLRGRVDYFRLAGPRGVFEELDQWIRRRVRANLWRQWKRNYTRAKHLMHQGKGVAFSHQWSWTVVECRRFAHEPGSSQEILRCLWTRVPA